METSSKRDILPLGELTIRSRFSSLGSDEAILSSLSPLSPARFGQDFYVTPLFVDPGTGRANFRVFINPMVNFIWFGGLIFVIGAHLSVLPDALERKRLEGAMALEERAVA